MLNSHKPSQQIYQRFPHRANYFFEANEPPKPKNLMMDLSKLNIDTLDSSNWGTWSAQVQSAARILNCWDVIKGEVVVPVTTPPTYSLLARPTAQTQTNAALLAEELASWNKKNSTALGVIQGKTSSAIWPEFINHADAATLWTALETKYGKAGGHYLSPSSEFVQGTHDGFISVASPNSGLPRKLHADFSEWSLKVIRGHCYLYFLFFSSNIIPRPRITISYIDRGHHQVQVAKNHCTGHRRRVSTQSADQRSRIWIANP